MADFRLVLPGVTPEQAAAIAADEASNPRLEVLVAGADIRARVRVERSTQPALTGRLSACAEGTLVEGRLDYARPLAFVLAYGAMTLASVLYAGSLAQQGSWTGFAVVGAGAVLLLAITWLSMHAGLTHHGDDTAWLQDELLVFFDPARRWGTLDG